LFFQEFQCRMNYVAFEYLVYPTEVCCNIWQSYPTGQLLLIVAAVGFTLYLTLRSRFLIQAACETPWRRRLAICCGTFAAIAALWLSLDISSMSITQDRAVNECAGNGLYCFVYHAWTCHVEYEEWYPTLAPQLARSHLRRQLATAGTVFSEDSANPVDRTISVSKLRNAANVVIILEESFGAESVGALGDPRGLTPQFDALCERGLLFDNFYATGNRTARALEAVLTSLPPIPTESILKRDHSDHVFTLAHILAERGYERLFMTGGRGMFDGVRSFMTSNGFNRFVEQQDYSNPVFTNAWGVSDEDLFHRAIEEFDSLHAAGRPFLGVLLTVSNHRPYTFPAGRIPSATQSRESALRYADWSLGQFFRQSRGHAFYRNTLFVVMGDHGARVYGSQLFPLASYRVPVLLLRGDSPTADRCHTLGCSLDIGPTIMGLLGGSYRTVFFGRDLLSLPLERGCALMQHNHDIAILQPDNQMVVLGTGRAVTGYRLDPVTDCLTRNPWPDPKLTEETIAYFQIANRVYYDECCFPDPSAAPYCGSSPAKQAHAPSTAAIQAPRWSSPIGIGNTARSPDVSPVPRIGQ